MKDAEYIEETIKTFREMFGRHMAGKEQMVRFIILNAIERGFQSGMDTAKIREGLDLEKFEEK